MSKGSGHRWSGWPGAYCLKCGAGQALEVALADGWFDFEEETYREIWKSDEHRELVHLLDSNCTVDMTEEEIESMKKRVKELEGIIKASK